MQRNVQLALIFIALLFVLTLAGYWMQWEWMPLGESIYGFYDSIVSYFSGEDETTDTGTSNQSAQNPVVVDTTKATETNAETSQAKDGSGAASAASTAAVGIYKTIGDKKYQCKAQNTDLSIQGENEALCAQHTMKKGETNSTDCENQEGDMFDYSTGETKPAPICYWYNERVEA